MTVFPLADQEITSYNLSLYKWFWFIQKQLPLLVRFSSRGSYRPEEKVLKNNQLDLSFFLKNDPSGTVNQEQSIRNDHLLQGGSI